MNKIKKLGAVITLNLNHASALPLYAQIKHQVLEEILCGRLPTGARLPQIKKISRDNSVAVITVERAYRQLEKEGFVMRKKGDGCFVSPVSSTARILFIAESMDEFESVIFVQLDAAVEVKCFFCDVQLLEEIVKQSMDVYQYFIVTENLLESDAMEAHRKVLKMIPDTRLLSFHACRGSYPNSGRQFVSKQLKAI